MKKIISVFLIFMFLFCNSIFLYANEETTDLSTLNNNENIITTEKSESVYNMTENEFLDLKTKYTTLVKSYGFSAKIDAVIISSPLYRKSVKNPNSKYYCNLTITELAINKEIGFSAIYGLKDILDSLNIEYFIEENGDIVTLKIAIKTHTLYDIAYLLNETNYIITLLDKEYPSTLSISFFNNDSSVDSFSKFVLSNAKINIVLKTKNNVQSNADIIYKTNEDGYDVYKYELIPNETTNYTVFINDQTTYEILNTNLKLQIVICIVFNICFLVYYMIDRKRE